MTQHHATPQSCDGSPGSHCKVLCTPAVSSYVGLWLPDMCSQNEVKRQSKPLARIWHRPGTHANDDANDNNNKHTAHGNVRQPKLGMEQV